LSKRRALYSTRRDGDGKNVFCLFFSLSKKALSFIVRRVLPQGYHLTFSETARCEMIWPFFYFFGNFFYLSTTF
jgi:hypothetical protein